MTGLKQSGIVHQLSLIDYFGNELFNNNTEMLNGNSNLFYIGPFKPPKGFFFVRVIGEDEMASSFLI